MFLVEKLTPYRLFFLEHQSRIYFNPYPYFSIIQGENKMIKVGIIIGSTRPGRNGEAVGKWVNEVAQKRSDAQFELVDIKDFNLPLLDEPASPSMGFPYTQAHTRVWSDKIKSLDAFVFVTPEYNHSTSGALKNAIDFLYSEWNNKAAGFVGYGTVGGARAIEGLRTVMAELQVADVRAQVMFSLFTDFKDFRVFQPAEFQVGLVNTMLDQVVSWGSAMQTVRASAKVAA
jgi:NAD(P)H-dependent FMN reductase